MTRALHAIQDDAVRLARKITGHVEDCKPEEMSPRALARYAEQLNEIARRLAHHQAHTPEAMARVARIAMNGHSEPDPR
jgi:hypothetical protein